MNVFDLVAKISLDTTEYDGALRDASNATNALSGTITKRLDKAGKIATRVFTAAGAAVTTFGVKSVKVGANFDKSMSQVYATMGDKAEAIVEYNGQTMSSMDALRLFVQEMGETTVFSATQAADALNYMALAGYDAETSMKILPNVLDLAAAGSMDLARASDMVTDTQTAFGISLDRTSQMVDEMAKAASTGNTSVEQLGDAFLTVGGLAQELNGGVVDLSNGTKASVDGIQELEIALVAMANAGIKGTEAGTHMRNMLLKLSSPTSEGTKMLEELGVAVFDAEGNMRSLSDIFGDLNTSLGELTQEQKIQAISELFNTRDLASAEALLNAIDSDWDAIGESILDSQGAAQKMASTQLDNLAGDITLFKSAVEGAQISISDALSPTLRELAQLATEKVGEITKYIKEHSDEIAEKVKTVGTWIIEHIPEIISTVKTLAKVLAGLWVADKIVKVINTIKGVIKIFGELKTTIKGVKATFDVLKVAMAANPAVAIIAGITALIAIFVTLWNKCKWFRDFWIGLWNNLKESAEFVIKIIGDAVSAGWDFIKGIWETASEFFSMIWEGIKTVFMGVVDFFSGIFQGAWNIITTIFAPAIAFFSGIWEGIQSVLSTVISFFSTIFSAAWSAITDVWNAAVGFFSGIWNGITSALSGVASWFGDIFRTAYEAVTGIWDAITTFFSDLWDDIVAVFKDAGVAVGDAISNAVKGAVNAVLSGAVGIINGFISAINVAIKVINAIPGVPNISYLSKLEVPQLEDGIGLAKKGHQYLLEGKGNEAVVPIDKDQAWTSKVAKDMIAALASQGAIGAGGSGDIIIPIYLGDDMFEEVVIKAQQIHDFRNGGIA